MRHNVVGGTRRLRLQNEFWNHCGKWPFGVGLGLAAFVAVVAAFILIFCSSILDGYGKDRLERTFDEAHPGSTLRIGQLHYSVVADHLTAGPVKLSNTNTTLQADRISLTGLRWARVLMGTARLADVLGKATLEVTNLDVQFTQAHYGLRCARLWASVPISELTVQGAELRTLAGDEEFFASHDFRTTRFHLAVPEGRIMGLAYRELLEGKSYRARSIHLSHPSLDALVNSDKPVQPLVKPALMVNEALAAIRKPLQVDSLSIANGRLKYAERLVAGADPGVLTFGSVNVSVAGLANRGGKSAAIRLRAQSDFMNAGVLRVMMTVPVAAPNFSFRCCGSLSAMDLVPLDAFLDIVEHTRIKSGSVQEAAFEIDVTDGHARGRVRAVYENLEIAVLDKQTGSTKGLGNRVASFLTNVKIRHSNAPDESDSMKEGMVNYQRKPADEFQQFVWFALRSGVLDVITY